MPSTAALTSPLTEKLTGDLFGSTFSILGLNPLLYFDAKTSMLNGSGNQAGFLERVATLDNLTGGPDATHGTDTQRPRALPLIDDKGYLFTSGVHSNNATFDEPILPSSGDFSVTVKFVVGATSTNHQCFLSQYTASGVGRLLWRADTNNKITFFIAGSPSVTLTGGTWSLGAVHTARVTRVGNLYSLFVDNMSTAVATGSTSTGPLQTNTVIGDAGSVTTQNFRGAVMSVTVDSDVDCDFTDTSVAHGASSFDCSTGQTVTINKTGRDPSLLLRRPVLRFDGAATNHSRLRGVFSDDVNTAHAFMKFAVNGDDFEDTSPATLCLHRTDHWLSNAANLYTGTGTTGTNGRTYIAASVMAQSGKWDDDNGTIVAEIKVSDGAHHSKIDNSSKKTDSRAYSLNSNKFRIAEGTTGGQAPIDVEQMVLFDRVVSEADANDLYNHIK